ncbi:prepilin peptidase [Promicromonospora panici]|uniref:prepilin peptidase n=1 Tax=Promicromonospora panici TaxID=2219658 RepID=UPI00101C680D|nr:prepilin peptidase [Promicromonospora panici]
MEPVPVLLAAVVAGVLAAACARWVQKRVATVPSAWLRTLVLAALAAVGGACAAAAAPTWPEAVAFTVLALACALLVAVDLAEQRIPDRVLGPAYLSFIATLTLAAAVSGEWPRLGRAALAAVVLCAGYFLLALVSPSGLGLGDVKLSGLLGAYLGWLGWPEVLFGTLSAFAIAGIVAALLVLVRRRSRRSDVAFGPWMVLGAALATVWTPPCSY